MTALAYDRNHDPDLRIDPIDEFIDELFAATPRRRHLTVVTGMPSRSGHALAAHSVHVGHSGVAGHAPAWIDGEPLHRRAPDHDDRTDTWALDYEAADPIWQPATTPRRRGLVRLFVRTFQAVVLVDVALVMVVSMLPTSVDAVDVVPETTIHVVQPGDTLWNLAEGITPPGRDIGLTIAAIKSANELPTSMLVPGDQIVIPHYAG